MSTTITDVAGLQAMKDNLSEDYVLGNNIDASATSGWNNGAGFIPVGDNSTKFTGTFDGASYTISGLYIDRSTTDYIGLFGYAWQATISDVTLASCDITGDDRTGGLVGGSYETVFSDCHIAGTITGYGVGVGGLGGQVQEESVTDCSSSCTVIGTNKSDVGSLIGYSYDVIFTDSYATGNVTGDYSIGGFVGDMQGSDSSATRCHATGVVTGEGTGYDGYEVGGFAGSVGTGIIFSECYSTGDTTSNYDHVGGFIGGGSSITVSDCYSRSDVTGDDAVGGFIGDVTSGATFTNAYSTGVVTGTTHVGGFAGNSNGTITSSFWDTQTSGQASSDGGAGKTTAIMKALHIYTEAGWDIALTTTDRNNGYPFLSWEINESDTIWLKTKNANDPASETPKLESLMLSWMARPNRIRGWTFNVVAKGDEAKEIFTNLHTAQETNTLLTFYPSGDDSKSSYSVVVTKLPESIYWDTDREEGEIQVTVEEVFRG